MDIEAIRQVINGKKTYLIAVASLIGVILAWSGKSIDNQTALEQTIGLLIAMTIRHGIAKTPSAPVDSASSAKDIKDGIRITLK